MSADAQALKAEGNAAFQKGDFQKAVMFFTQAIDVSPSDNVLYSNRSGAYASLGKYQEALEDAIKCISLKPDWAKGYSRKGLAELQLGKLREAIQTYETGLKIDPNNAALKEGLIDAQSKETSMVDMQSLIAVSQAIQKSKKLQKYSQADPTYMERLVEIIKQIQKDPNNLKLIMAQPDICIKEGVTVALGGTIEEDAEEESKPSEASRHTAEKSVKTSSNKPAVPLSPEEEAAEAAKTKGNELYKQKKFTEALAAYDEAIKLNPKEILYLSNKAAVYMEMGEYEKCIKECEKAIEMRYDVKADFTKVGKVFNRIAACYARQKEYEKAIEMYEKSLCEDNNRFTRAALTQVQKDFEKASREAYIDPEKAEQHREKGNEYFKVSDFPAAKKEYDEAIKRNPKDAKLYSNRAAALTKLLEYPSALKDVDMALSLDPNFVKAWSRKGTLHFLLKEYSKAMEAFDKGLAIEPENKECRDGKMNVLYKVQQQQMSGEVDEEQMRHSMADPEIQQILRDPQMSIVLSNLQENPMLLKEYMKDPKIQNGINKLITAGILRVG